MPNWDHEEKDRPEKAKVRRWVYASKMKKYLHALMMPAAKMVDVKVALELKYNIGHYTFVERDSSTFKDMVETYQQLVAEKLLPENNATLVKKEISSLIFDKDKPPIDLAVIDLCGNINDNMAVWIASNLKNSLANNALVSFTFTYNKRGKEETLGELYDWMKTDHPLKFKRNFSECRRTDEFQRKLETSYKTFFQVVFPNSMIGHPVAYKDTAWKMMTWKFRNKK